MHSALAAIPDDEGARGKIEARATNVNGMRFTQLRTTMQRDASQVPPMNRIRMSRKIESTKNCLFWRSPDALTEDITMARTDEREPRAAQTELAPPATVAAY